MGNGPKYYNIEALRKAFSMIEMMTNKAQWELKDVASSCDLPKGTSQRILLMLCDLGYVRQESKGGTYSLTLKFFKYGRRIVANNSFVDQARPICHELMKAVNETVNLCMVLSTDVVVVSQQVSSHVLRLDPVLGSSFPVYNSASGKTYSAFLDEQAFNKLVQEIRNDRKEITDENIETWFKDIELIRSEGVGFDYEEVFAGVHCVSAPIFDYTGGIVASISCSVPTVRLTAEFSESLIFEVCRSASIISKLLGASVHTFSPLTRTMLNCQVK